MGDLIGAALIFYVVKEALGFVFPLIWFVILSLIYLFFTRKR